MSIRITIAGWSALVCLLASGCVGWQFQPGSGPSRWSQRTSESPIEAWPGETPGAKAELNARNASQSGSTPTASRYSLAGQAATQTGRRGTAVSPPQADNNPARETAHPTATGRAETDGSPLGSLAASGLAAGGSPASSLRSRTLAASDRSELQVASPDANVFQADRAEPKSADELPPVEVELAMPPVVVLVTTTEPPTTTSTSRPMRIFFSITSLPGGRIVRRPQPADYIGTMNADIVVVKPMAGTPRAGTGQGRPGRAGRRPGWRSVRADGVRPPHRSVIVRFPLALIGRLVTLPTGED